MTIHSLDDIPAVFANAWNSGDAKTLALLFAEDADFVNVTGIWWRRRRAIEKAHDYALKRYFRDARLTLETCETRRLGASVAVLHLLWRLDGQYAPDGTEAESRKAIMIMITERRDEGWVVVAAQNTDIVPGSETNLAQNNTLQPISYDAN